MDSLAPLHFEHDPEENDDTHSLIVGIPVPPDVVAELLVDVAIGTGVIRATAGSP